MTYPTNWNQYLQAPSEHTKQTDLVYDGNAAFRDQSTDGSDPSASIYAPSESANPTEAQVTMQVYARSYAHLPMYLRFQDKNNYYAAGFAFADVGGGNAAAAILVKSVGGTTTVVDYSRSNGLGGTWGQVTLSDGSTAAGEWSRFRYRVWEDSGSLWFRGEEDADGDGNWSQLGNDLVDNNPDLSSGGGVGIGSTFESAGGGQSVSADNVEVYY